MRYGSQTSSPAILFNKYDWFKVVEQQKMYIEKAIQSYDGEKMINTSSADLVEYFCAKHTIDVPVLDEGNIVADQFETQIDVSSDPYRSIRDRSRPAYVTGTRVEVEVPYTGDRILFDVQPSSYNLSPPRASVSDNCIVLVVEGTQLETEHVKQNIESWLQDVNGWLSTLRSDAEKFNDSLYRMVMPQVQSRVNKLLADKNLAAGLGFPLKERKNVTSTYASPVVRRKLEPKQPNPSSKPFKPEPTLSRDDYEYILTLMERMVSVMELSPRDFRTVGEETLRSHFLVQLNAQFEGQATGETFNFEGKTDILVKAEGKNIFIAECKFWKGEKAFQDTIDQLLGYLSWRDTKAAIVIFNRNKNFSSVLETIEGCTVEHNNCKRLLVKRSDTSWRYQFFHRDDPNREMEITVMAFDVPSK